MELSERRKMILSLSNEESHHITKEAVQGALFRLLDRMSIREIKVVDLVKAAGISRSAFYRNYDSVESVLLEAVDEPVCRVNQAIGNPIADNRKLILKTLRENDKWLRILSDSGLFHVLLDRMNAGLAPNDYRMAMWNGMIYNLIHLWVQNGMPDDSAFPELIDTESLFVAKAIPEASSSAG